MGFTSKALVSALSACTAYISGSVNKGLALTGWLRECRMTDELTRLVEAARLRPFPEKEREAQRRSFAYGNAKIANDRVTMEMIIEADEEIKRDNG